MPVELVTRIVTNNTVDVADVAKDEPTPSVITAETPAPFELDRGPANGPSNPAVVTRAAGKGPASESFLGLVGVPAPDVTPAYLDAMRRAGRDQHTNTDARTTATHMVGPGDSVRSTVTIAPGDLFVDPDNPDVLPAGLAGPRVVITNGQWKPLVPGGGTGANVPEGDELAAATAIFATLNHAIRFAEAALGRPLDFAKDAEVVTLWNGATCSPHFSSQYRGQMGFGGPTPVPVSVGSSWGGSSWDPTKKSLSIGRLKAEQIGRASDADMAAYRHIPLHELGHAVTFALRPEWIEEKCLRDIETRAIQEGLADYFAIANLLDEPAVASRVVTECGGDLKAAHFLADFAHDYYDAKLAYLIAEGYRDPKVTQRSAINDCHRDDEGLMPAKTRGSMGSVVHPHAFEQLVTGTLYDLTAAIAGKRANPPTARTLREAAGVVMQLVMRGLEHPPADRPMDCEELFAGMMKVDQELFAGRYGATIKETISARGFHPALDGAAGGGTMTVADDGKLLGGDRAVTALTTTQGLRHVAVLIGEEAWERASQLGYAVLNIRLDDQVFGLKLARGKPYWRLGLRPGGYAGLPVVEPPRA